MAYKSLYRKYRPSNFEDVYGQQFIIKTLNNAIENNKISHAYLFTGTRGTGKTTIAKIFAKMVNCLDMQDNIPCGKCEICLKENTDEIPDIIEIDAASNNGVDEIRELKNKIKLVPVMCKYKVYIIDEVHMLSTGAFNALLKTLEEPPAHVIFILATTEPQKLPITIISRCQRFDFKKIAIEDIYNRLKYISNKENININDDALLEISKMSDGAMRDAIGTLDQVSSYADNLITIDDIYTLKGSISTNLLFDLTMNYVNRDFENMLNIIEQVYVEGKNFYLIVDDMLMLFRNVLINKKARKYFLNKDVLLKDEIEKISEILDISSVENIIIKFEELSKNIKESNYPRILFEIYLLSDFSIAKQDKKDYEQKNNNLNPEVIVNKLKNNDEQETKQITKNVNTLNLESNVYINENTNEIKFDFENKPQTENKKVLINNTIALASNKVKRDIQQEFDNIDKYLIEKKYKNAATILKDANIAAASEDHLLLTYKYSSMVENHDNEISTIRQLISKMLLSEYKVVAITEEEWKEQRPYYLNLKKLNGKIDLLDEKIEENKIENKNKKITTGNELIDIFGSDLIEMEG